MNNQDKIVATVAIFLKTESSDEYLYCLSGGKQRILAAIKNKLGCELECVFKIAVEANIPHGVEDYSDDEVGKITISLGVATLQPNETIHELISRADSALYQSKRNGRNQVTISS